MKIDHKICRNLKRMIDIQRLLYSQSHLNTQESGLIKIPSYIKICENFTEDKAHLVQGLINSMKVHSEFITEAEEQTLMEEVDPYMRKLHYEFDHWDNAIHGYRETERLNWNEENSKILNRVRNIAFIANETQLKYVHILDLDKSGYIKPHIDAVRFCGDTIAGLSLLTDSVMRLVHDKHKELSADVLLTRRSLYIMTETARFDYTHEILGNDHSIFKGQNVFKDRRISVICRNAPRAKSRNL